MPECGLVLAANPVSVHSRPAVMQVLLNPLPSYNSKAVHMLKL